MKQALATIAGVALAIVIAIGIVYWQNLRGIWPVIKPPPQDITQILKSPAPTLTATANPTISRLPQNTIGMPLKLPDGFSISIFAKDLGKPRVMAWDPSGRILVSIPSQGKVVALRDADAGGSAEDVRTVISELNSPHGLTFYCAIEPCKLYVAETDNVAVYDYDAANARATNKRKIVDLPGAGGHFTRTLLFMPYPNENKLLISVGSSCNVCVESDWRRAKVLIANYDGSGLKEFATGLRNAVFMTIHPVTGKIWVTEMGRDHLGDDLPPDEINILEEGKFYGWPYCYGKNIWDKAFNSSKFAADKCKTAAPSYIDIPAHSSPLGLAFFPEEGWPEEYWHNLLVAYHGSWNRSVPTGYKIVRYKLDSHGNYLGKEDFITGWLTPQGALGRPVDILIQPGGVIYISDDKAGVIYRVTYRAPQPDMTNLIRATSPKPNETIKSPLAITGEARGNWYFEASFPVKLLDGNGNFIAQWYAEALSDWMTTEFVPFKATLVFPAQPAGTTGMLVLEKDNPSGLPEHADELRIPIKF